MQELMREALEELVICTLAWGEWNDRVAR